MTSPSQGNRASNSASFELPESLRPPKDARLWIGGHNTLLRGQLDQELKSNPRPPTGPIDLAIITPLTTDEALYFAAKVKPRLPRGGTIWIATPKTNQNLINTKSTGEEFESQLAELGLKLVRTSTEMVQSPILSLIVL